MRATWAESFTWDSGLEMRRVRTCSELVKPGWTSRSDRKVRSIRPELMRRTRASATWGDDEDPAGAVMLATLAECATAVPERRGEVWRGIPDDRDETEEESGEDGHAEGVGKNDRIDGDLGEPGDVWCEVDE